MTKFTIHTAETAPEAAKPLLQAVNSKMGLVPNLLGEFAEAPNVLKAYLDISGNVAAGTLSPLEQQIVQITTSRLNGCHYCVAAHSTIADMQKLDHDTIEAIRDDRTISNPKHEALRQFTKSLVSKHGHVTDPETDALLAAGYTQAQILEVVLSVAMKTITNYANAIMHTPVDGAFQARAIDPGSLRKAS